MGLLAGLSKDQQSIQRTWVQHQDQGATSQWFRTPPPLCPCSKPHPQADASKALAGDQGPLRPCHHSDPLGAVLAGRSEASTELWRWGRALRRGNRGAWPALPHGTCDSPLSHGILCSGPACMASLGPGKVSVSERRRESYQGPKDVLRRP